MFKKLFPNASKWISNINITLRKLYYFLQYQAVVCWSFYTNFCTIVCYYFTRAPIVNQIYRLYSHTNSVAIWILLYALTAKSECSSALDLWSSALCHRELDSISYHAEAIELALERAEAVKYEVDPHYKPVYKDVIPKYRVVPSCESVTEPVAFVAVLVWWVVAAIIVECINGH